MTIQEARQDLLSRLKFIYDDRESLAIADWVMEYLTGWKKVDRIVNKNEELSPDRAKRLDEVKSLLLAHKPVQYVLGEAWFRGMKFSVDERVLIPRPETEELVEWVGGEIGQLLHESKKINLIDVGTGSGCIPISVKKEWPVLEVYACDLSEGALQVAKKNAAVHQAEISLQQLDFLERSERDILPAFNIVISNPPYIAEKEKSEIDRHVLEYEPHLALFVPADDPLIFYAALADFGKNHLAPGGFMMMEIHAARGNAVTELFSRSGYKSILRKDLHGNDRMIKVWQ